MEKIKEFMLTSLNVGRLGGLATFGGFIKFQRQILKFSRTNMLGRIAGLNKKGNPVSKVLDINDQALSAVEEKFIQPARLRTHELQKTLRENKSKNTIVGDNMNKSQQRPPKLR